MKLNRLSSLTIALFSALIFAAALLWLSANVAASTAGPSLFSDDFEGGSANWTPIEGAWSVVSDGSHVYQQDDVSVTGRSVAGAPEWTDYVAQARIKPVSGKYAMLMVRYQDPNNYYLFALRTDNGKMEMKKMSNGSSGSALAGSRYIPITPGEWYTATFEAVGTTLRAFINGTPVMTYTDNAGTPPFMAGKIGLGTLNAVAEFDDVSVVSLVPVYPLRVTRAGTGDGSVSSLPAGIECSVTCTADFTAGTVVTLTAAPKPDSVFAGWIGAGCGNTDSCVVTMDAAKSVAAVFSALSQPTLIVNKDGTGSGSVTRLARRHCLRRIVSRGLRPGRRRHVDSGSRALLCILWLERGRVQRRGYLCDHHGYSQDGDCDFHIRHPSAHRHQDRQRHRDSH